MFQINAGDLPFLRTRQALLVLDLQNDLVEPESPLYVDKPSEWIERISDLVPNFRKSGIIFWVRSQFEVSRPINNADKDAERVITDAELRASCGHEGEQKALRTARANSRVKGMLEKIAARNQSDLNDVLKDLAPDEKSTTTENETFLTVENDATPQIVLPMTMGMNFSQDVAKVVDVSKDIVFAKTHYSAFKSGTLLETLRRQLVTEIFICGALTNISIFATVMEAARYGFLITLVEDCLGYRSKARHDEAIRVMTETAGCEIISSSELKKSVTMRLAAPPPTQLTDVRNRRKNGDSKDPRQTMMGPRRKLEDRERNGMPGTSRSTSVTSPLTTATSNPRLSNDSSESIPSVSDESLDRPLPIPPKSDPVERKRVPNKIKSRRRRSDSTTESNGRVSESKTVVSPTHATLAGATKVLKNLSLNDEESQSEPLSYSMENVSDPKHTIDIAIPEKDPLSSEYPGAGQTFEKMASVKESSDAGAPVSSGVQPDMTVDGKNEEEVLPTTTTADQPSDPQTIEPSSEGTYPLCDGSSSIIHNVLPASVSSVVFSTLRSEVVWRKMQHLGGEVPRLVAVQGEVGSDGSIPIYRHPADESPPLLPFSPTVIMIKEEVEKKIGHKLNHCLIQFYRSGNDFISEHSDKTLDIAPGTYICNVSLGAMRAMTFRTKRPPKNRDDQGNLKGDEKTKDDEVAPRTTCKAPLPHNSLVMLSLATNATWLHSIRPDKRIPSLKNEAELDYDGARISLTFRLIHTFLSKYQTMIWGTGAIGKSKEEARSVINGEPAESEKMINAMGKENQNSIFSWAETYGAGCDVLHMSNARKLFLSNNSVANNRVKLALACKNMEYIEAKLSPVVKFQEEGKLETTEETPVPVFRDNDIARSQVEGDIAILLYLDSLPSNPIAQPPASNTPDALAPTQSPTQPPTPTPTSTTTIKPTASPQFHTPSPPLLNSLHLARKYTRLQQAESLRYQLDTYTTAAPSQELLSKFEGHLALWEGYATEAGEEGFLNGDGQVGIVDWAFWPVMRRVREVVEAVDVEKEARKGVNGHVVDGEENGVNGTEGEDGDGINGVNGMNGANGVKEKPITTGWDEVKHGILGDYYDRISNLESVRKAFPKEVPKEAPKVASKEEKEENAVRENNETPR